VETVDHSHGRINLIVLVHRMSLSTKTITTARVTPLLLAKSGAWNKPRLWRICRPDCPSDCGVAQQTQ